MKHITATALALGSILTCTAVHALSFSKTAVNNLSAKLTLASDTLEPAKDGSVSTLQATYTITNPTKDNITYQQSGRPVIWSVLDSHGTIVADPERGKMIPMFIALRILRPGEHVDFDETIPLVSVNGGTPLPPGSYTLQAYLEHAPALRKSTTFTIK